MTEYMWAVPLLPFIAFFVILFFGKRMKNGGHSVGIAAIAVGLVMSIWAFVELAAGNAAVEKSWTWITIGEDLHLEFGMNYDFLTGVMFVVVTAVSLLVQIYSTGYMHDDKRYTWFYACLALFTSSMLLLVLANNLLMMLVGWEGVGVCSYFLIGHYWEEKENSSAAMKAFLTTRVGDIGFMFGIIALFVAGHTFNIVELNEAAEHGEIGCNRVDGRRAASFLRGGRKVGAVPAPRVASGRHGGPHARLGPHPRGDDGRCRCLPRGPDVRAVRARRLGPQRRGDHCLA